jgi:hypothetical protein
VGILGWYAWFHVNFMQNIIQKRFECGHAKQCELIHNVLYNEERVMPLDTL